jgi:predicted membrane-bound mannosyltransferase
MTEEEQAAHEDLVLQKPYLAQVEAGIRWWERMRLLYNGVLFFTGVLLVMSTMGTMALLSPFLWFGAFVLAFMANLCYTLGPGLDAYLYIFSQGRSRFENMRMALWLVGTMFSVLVELVMVLGVDVGFEPSRF